MQRSLVFVGAQKSSGSLLNYAISCLSKRHKGLHPVFPFFVSSCAGSLEAYAAQFDTLFQTQAQAPWHSHLSVGLATAARPVQDSHGAGRCRAAGPSPGGRGVAAAVFPVRGRLGRRGDQCQTLGAAYR